MPGPSGRWPAGGTRRRRPPWLLILVLLLAALVVGEVVDQVVGSSRALARRSAHSFVAAVAPLVDESNALVPVLEHVRTDAPSLTRRQLDTLLSELTSGSATVESQLGALELGPPTRKSGDALTAAITARAQASTALAGALELATTEGDPTARATALRRLEQVAADLTASDADYRRFRRLLPAHAGVDALPDSVWMTAASAWRPASLTALVDELAHRPALTATRRVALLAVSLEPRPIAIRGLPTPTTTTTTTTTSTTTTTTTTLPGGSVPRASTTTSAPQRAGKVSAGRARGTTTSSSTTSTTTTLQIPPPGAVSVVPATRHLVVTAVVASTGNRAAPGVRLSATLTPTKTGTGGPLSVARTLGDLKSGAARFVRLPAFAVRPSTAYRLVVTASTTAGSSRQATVALTVEP